MSSSLAQCTCNPSYFGDTTVGGQDLTLCQICRPGSYCPGGTANFTVVCPNNTYSLPGSDDVFDCQCPANSVSTRGSQNITECVCQSGYYKEFSLLYPPANWYCKVCNPGEFCFQNVNYTCPAFSASLGSAQSLLDCFCQAGYYNVTINRTPLNFCQECPRNFFCAGKGAIQ